MSEPSKLVLVVGGDASHVTGGAVAAADVNDGRVWTSGVANLKGGRGSLTLNIETDGGAFDGTTLVGTPNGRGASGPDWSIEKADNGF